jgi:hypothetical protein
VWQIGGQIAENGVALDETALVAKAAAELREAIPGINLAGVEFAAYRVDRAEGRTQNGKRPETLRIHKDGNVITAWPTKLVLAPQLALAIAAEVPTTNCDRVTDAFTDWPRPQIALPPWETTRGWYALEDRAQKAA